MDNWVAGFLPADGGEAFDGELADVAFEAIKLVLLFLDLLALLSAEVVQFVDLVNVERDADSLYRLLRLVRAEVQFFEFDHVRLFRLGCYCRHPHRLLVLLSPHLVPPQLG